MSFDGAFQVRFILIDRILPETHQNKTVPEKVQASIENKSLGKNSLQVILKRSIETRKPFFAEFLFTALFSFVNC